MYDVNVSIRSGRLVADPEVKADNKGRHFVKFRLAVNRTKEKADFFSYVAWESYAVGFVEKYCRKGTKVIVVGRDQFKETADKKLLFESICKEIYFAESKAAAEQPAMMMSAMAQIASPGADLNVDGDDEVLL